MSVICKALGALSLAVFFIGGAARPVVAQTASGGTVTGRVTFESDGVPVHGATVIVVGARRTATTGDDGRFEITNVPAGKYEVLVQREHLTTARRAITIDAGQTQSVDFALAVGVHEELTVTGSATGAATTFDSFSAMTSLDSTEIARRIGATIADVLQDEPGIAKRSFGPGTSRPIIRGFDGDRVLIMQDGVRTGDLSSQSGDHGVSIDAAGLQRIEVVKGPATLLYGSNAIGGVVNAITPPEAFRSSPFTGTLGAINVDTGSANAQAGLSGNVQHGRGPWLLYGALTSRRTGDYDTPSEKIGNSATRLSTGEGGFAWTGHRAFVGVGAGAERNRYGIPFAGALEGEPDAQIDLKIKRQNVRVDAGARNLSGFADNIRVTASFLDYQHDELEIEDGVESLGTRFNNQVFNLRAELEQKRTGRLNGRLGADVLTRDYEAIGAEALSPATRQNGFAAFAYEEFNFGARRVLLGGRVDRTSYEAEGLESRTFTGASGSVGVHADLGRQSAAVFNVSGASRAPALEELFNFGPHPGNLAFEVGNPNLEIERTIGFDASLRSRSRRVSGEVNVFLYNISNFVFLDFTGEIEDGLRVADYVQGDSRFMGADAKARVSLGRGAQLNASFGYVRAQLTERDEDLPRIPPLQGRVGLDLTFRQLTVTPEFVFAARQRRVFDAETNTDGWATVNIGASWQRFRGHQSHLIAVQGYNLLNREYRLHTSFIKDLAPEMGRGIKVSYGVKLF